MKKIEDKYKKLNDIDHCLARPGMYIGSVKPQTAKKYIYVDGKMSLEQVTYNPGFQKIFDEIITNSVDESKRDGSRLNTINIQIDSDKITIWDNGGIPVIKHSKHKEWIPEMVFSNMKAGSNFHDSENRTWAGTNGVGSSCVNIFSKEFSISTCDGKNHFSQTFSNNMRERTTPIIKKSKKSHTEITFKPDLERFGMDSIDRDNFKMIEKRVYDLSATNRGVKFIFNGKPVGIKSFEDYIKLYTDDYIINKSTGDWSLAIAPSDNGFQQVSFANSIETYDGGTHVEWVMNQVINSLREFFSKKHKIDVKPSELRNHMFLFLDSTVINPSFSSQTKEKLITESKEFAQSLLITEKFISLITKSEIVNSVLDWYQQKKNAEENKIQRDLNKKLGKIKVEKLIDSKGKDRWKHSLFVFEGDSASSSFRKYRDPQTMGAFSLRGKFINVSEITNQKLSQNNEAVNLMASIGLKMASKVDLKSLRYGRILIATDADVDGNSIASLLINFFYKYWPDVFDRNMIYKLETPIVVAVPLNKKMNKISFYNQNDYNTWAEKRDLKNWNIKYKKGLAALDDDEYRDIINSPKMTLITKDLLSSQNLDIWFGKSSDLRKNQLI
jgi:DNA topoisomerase II